MSFGLFCAALKVEAAMIGTWAQSCEQELGAVLIHLDRVLCLKNFVYEISIIEACYTYEKTSYVGDKRPRDIADEVRRNFTPLIRLISGGSDYHADEKKGVTDFRELGECGLTLNDFWGNVLLSSLVK